MIIKNKENIISELNLLAEKLTGYDEEKHNARFKGDDWPRTALSMIGMERMYNLRDLIIDVVEKDVPGDFIETGVWRGGACIFAASAFKMLNQDKRKVWVCDSFEGLPPPDPKYPLDNGDLHHSITFLKVDLDQVKNNFKSYGIIENVEFVKGFFCDTLPTLPAKTFSIIRLDGDMYSSTIDSLENLYPKLSTGGYTIIDDYGLNGARGAVKDYRTNNNIDSPIVLIDELPRACYWKK